MKTTFTTSIGFGILTQYASDFSFQTSVGAGLKAGDIYYNSTLQLYRYYNGSVFQTLGMSTPSTTLLNSLTIWNNSSGSALTDSQILIDSGQNLFWETDGAGSIGQSTDSRPGAIYAASEMHVGTSSSPTAAFSVNSITKGMLGPRMTQAERDSILSPDMGLMIFNTDTNQYEIYTLGSWQSFLSRDSAFGPTTDYSWNSQRLLDLMSLTGTITDDLLISTPDHDVASPALRLHGGNAADYGATSADIHLQAGQGYFGAFICTVDVPSSTIAPHEDLANWAPVPYNIWDIAQSYVVYDVTQYDSTLYQCILDIAPPESPDLDVVHWSIIDGWDLSTSYTAGDYAAYGTELYECILDIAPPDSPDLDAVHWSQINDWVLGNAYFAGDYAVDGSDLYVCIADIDPSNDAPSTDPVHWEEVLGVGSWSVSTSYTAGDLVSHASDFYLCILDIAPPDSPDLDAVHWSLLSPSAWDVSTSYTAGDLVSHASDFYLCILDIAPPESPDIDTTHWDVIPAWVSGSSYSVNDIVTDQEASQDGAIYFRTSGTDRVIIGQDTVTVDGTIIVGSTTTIKSTQIHIGQSTGETGTLTLGAAASTISANSDGKLTITPFAGQVTEIDSDLTITGSITSPEFDKIKLNQGTETQAASDTHTINWAGKTSTVWDLDPATDDITLTMANPTTGASYIIKVIQGTIARNIIWPANVHWPDGSAPIITTDDNAVDLIGVYYDGSNYYCTFTQDMKV